MAGTSKPCLSDFNYFLSAKQSLNSALNPTISKHLAESYLNLNFNRLDSLSNFIKINKIATI